MPVSLPIGQRGRKHLQDRRGKIDGDREQLDDDRAATVVALRWVLDWVGLDGSIHPTAQQDPYIRTGVSALYNPSSSTQPCR